MKQREWKYTQIMSKSNQLEFTTNSLTPLTCEDGTLKLAINLVACIFLHTLKCSIFLGIPNLHYMQTKNMYVPGTKRVHTTAITGTSLCNSCATRNDICGLLMSFC